MGDIQVPATFYTKDFGEVRAAISFLSSLRNIYNDLVLLFEIPSERVRQEHHQLPINLNDLLRQSPILEHEELHLGSVKLSSPGFWEFIGQLNPLNFLIELIKVVMEWHDRREKHKNEIMKVKYETVSGYIDLLDRYKKLRWSTIPEPDRFLQGHLERIMNALEREVVGFLLEGEPPKIREEEFRREDRIRLLRHDLTRGSNLEKMSALRQLEALRDPEFLPDIANQLRESQAVVHGLARDLLPGFGQAAIPFLLDVIEDPHAEWFAKSGALEALGRIDSPEVIPYIVRGLTDQHPNVRMAAAKGAGERRVEQAIPLLAKALMDENQYVREFARESLEKIGTSDAIQALRHR